MVKRIKKFIESVYGRRLAQQLFITYLSIFLVIVAVSSIFIYTWIVNVLKRNSEENSIQQFRQSHYNIEAFCNGVDLISVQLVIDTNLQNYYGYEDKPDHERIMLASGVLNKFSKIITNYRYIDSILFYGGDGLILKASYTKTEVAFSEESKKNWFFTSSLYQKAIRDKMKLVWEGGYSDYDFDISEDKEKNFKDGSRKYYMTAARTVFTGDMVGALVINIKLPEFISVYNNSSDAKSNERYIINSMGTIISHRDISKIGTTSEAFGALNEEWGPEENTFTLRYQDKQIVFYKLPVSSWILVDEVPISVITKDIKGLRDLVLVIFLASLVLAAVLSRYIIYRIISPLINLTMVMKKMEQGSLGLTLEVTEKNEIGVLVEQFNKMSRSIKELVELNKDIQEEKRNLEMEALKSQINPHFIYNTLNMIKWMAVIVKADNIVDSLTTLSNFLHPIFKKNNIVCPVKEEIEYIQNYIKIMNFRFAGRFKTNINIPEEIQDLLVLRFILQPVVENAINHGLVEENEGIISIEAYQKDNDMLISVSDNGKGMTEDQVYELNRCLIEGKEIAQSSNSGIGLYNVNRRIRLHYGESYGLIVQSKKGSGTKVVLKMPVVRKS